VVEKYLKNLNDCTINKNIVRLFHPPVETLLLAMADEFSVLTFLEIQYMYSQTCLT